MFEIQKSEATSDFPLKEWRMKFETNILDPQDLVSFFQSSASNFIHIEQKSNSDLGSYNFDESNAKHAVIDLIEKFICGDSSQSFLERLKSRASEASVCGRVFKIGEPTYSCRECSMDPTCVLCSSCFKKSSHRLHKYKMSTSGGGGCCDCGDSEAWKRDPSCEEHSATIPEILDSTLITDKNDKCSEIVFKAILYYCVKTLQIQSDSSLAELGDCEDEDVHCTILYNDETHTFEQVIQTLTSIVKCTQKEAIEYVTSIDREGRAVVKCASFEICKKLKEDIENKVIRSTMTTKASPLKVTVLHKSEVAYQHLAMLLLGW